MKARSFKGNSTEEIKTALVLSMSGDFTPTLAIVFLSLQQDRNAISKILDDQVLYIVICCKDDKIQLCILH